MLQTDILNPLTEAYRQNPYPSLKSQRDRAFIEWSPIFCAWVTSDYTTIGSILKDDRFSAKRIDTLFARLPEEVNQEMLEIKTIMKTWSLMLDPPEHDRFRTILNDAFSSRWIKSLECTIQEMVEDLLSKVENKKDFDFVKAIAYPLPAMVIANILGVTHDKMDWFKKLSKDIACVFNLSSRPEPDIAITAQMAIRELHAYLEVVLSKKELEGDDDLMSELLRREQVGEISREESKATLSMLLLAGHETTTQLLANGLLCFAREPESFQILKDNPNLMTTSIEEVLRFESPVQLTSRVCREPLEIAGQAIQTDQRVMMFLGGANRDDKFFDEPDLFDISRRPNKHLAFGAGRHYCVGAVLARLEAKIVFQTLCEQYDQVIHLEESPSWHTDVAFRSLNHLRLSLMTYN